VAAPRPVPLRQPLELDPDAVRHSLKNTPSKATPIAANPVAKTQSEAASATTPSSPARQPHSSTSNNTTPARRRRCRPEIRRAPTPPARPQRPSRRLDLHTRCRRSHHSAKAHHDRATVLILDDAAADGPCSRDLSPARTAEDSLPAGLLMPGYVLPCNRDEQESEPDQAEHEDSRLVVAQEVEGNG
jgi:hypothetical protein